MTQYAYFDSTAPAPAPVLGWFDTAAVGYPNLPSSADLLELTETQWGARMTGAWAVEAGALVAYTPPPYTPSAAQQAQAALFAGLAITSTGTPAINGSFAVDPSAQGKITGVEVYILKNGTFPGGAQSYPWPTLTGGSVTFPSVASFQAWATAIANYVSALDLIVAANRGSLPPASVTIA